jgi:hypothetical protein
MTEVADEAYEAVGVPRGQSVEVYQAAISNADLDKIPVFSDDGRNELCRILSDGHCQSIEVANPLAEVREWKFSTVVVDGQNVATILLCPQDALDRTSPPPTDAETMLLNAWSSREIGIARLNGAALVKGQFGSIEPQAQEALLRIANCSRLGSSGATYESNLSERVRLELKQDSRILKGIFPKLLVDAISQKIIKWRYLDYIFVKLKESFMATPIEALEVAKRALESEGQQFVNLVTSAGLQSFFEKLDDEIVTLKNDRNRFAWAIAEKVKKNIKNKSKYEKGVYAAYAIRCAIAHAGTMDVFYERFEDADDAVKIILPTVEDAIVAFIGLTGI